MTSNVISCQDGNPLATGIQYRLVHACHGFVQAVSSDNEKAKTAQRIEQAGEGMSAIDRAKRPC